MVTQRTQKRWTWVCVGLLQSGAVKAMPWGGNSWGQPHYQNANGPAGANPNNWGANSQPDGVEKPTTGMSEVFTTVWTSTSTTVSCSSTETNSPPTTSTAEPIIASFTPPGSSSSVLPLTTVAAVSVESSVPPPTAVSDSQSSTLVVATSSLDTSSSADTAPTTSASPPPTLIPSSGSPLPPVVSDSTSSSITPAGPATSSAAAPVSSDSPFPDSVPAPSSFATTSTNESPSDSPASSSPVVASSLSEVTPVTSSAAAPPPPPAPSSSTTSLVPGTSTASTLADSAPAQPQSTVSVTTSLELSSSTSTSTEISPAQPDSSSNTASSNTGGVFAPLPTGTSSLPVTTSYSISVSATQSASTSAAPASGSVHSSLETSGRTSVIPFNTTSLPTPSSTLVPVNSTLTASFVSATASQSNNIFVPIATDAPPSNIQSKPNHPVPRLGIENATGPIETNKFYANFFLGDQTMSTFTHPYSVSWLKGTGVGNSWGLGVQHIERSQLAYAPGDPPEYFINPLGLESIILSASELGDSTTLTTDSLDGFSVNVNLHPADGEDTLIQFPLVQGMGFVTGIYAGGTPLLESSIFFSTLNYVGSVGQGGNTFKYRITLNDGKDWLLYVTPKGSAGTPAFKLQSSSSIQGPAGFFGTVQIAKNPNGANGEKVFDASAGTYAVSASVSASVENATGSYTLAWDKGGVTSNKLLMFALPHHLASMDDTTSAAVTTVKLETTTKGMAQAVAADSITMSEVLPVDMDFAPYHPTAGSVKTVSTAAIAAIADAATSELSQNMKEQTDLDSMYFSGKGLAKFASIVYTTNDIAGKASLAAAGLTQLEAAFATFVNNNQQYPLVYDESWKGAVTSATYETGDSGVDFGNTYYNDHHFHYGYFVYAAAVIAYLNPSWLDQGTNKAWVSMLVRDYANPVSTDPYFPFSRSFDWYHGHSWAKGLFISGDGKDQESSSEDTFSLYAIKMWGKVSGDPNMEARGNLQLAVQARSLQNYFLLENDNKVQPPKFIPNKVTGILFENKVDHTTYFGTNIEYIEGIHMIPLNPASSLTRTSTFVQEEWDTYFSNGRADTVDSGWKGILYANLALTNPKASYQFFSQPGFQSTWLDGGASLTWYLAFAAGLGGA